MAYISQNVNFLKILIFFQNINVIFAKYELHFPKFLLSALKILTSPKIFIFFKILTLFSPNNNFENLE